jgi:hypothetical protein
MVIHLHIFHFVAHRLSIVIFSIGDLISLLRKYKKIFTWNSLHSENKKTTYWGTDKLLSFESGYFITTIFKSLIVSTSDSWKKNLPLYVENTSKLLEEFKQVPPKNTSH